MRTLRNFRSIDLPLFITDFASTTAPCFVVTTPSELVSQFNKVLTEVLDRHAPLQTTRRKVRLRQPWYNAEIHAARKMRRQSERRWRKSRLESQLALFMDQRRHVNRLIETAKRTYFATELQKADTKSIFRTVGSLFNTNTKPRPQCVSSQLLANDFVNFFTDKISKIRSNLESGIGSILHNPNPTTQPVIPVLDFDIASDNEIRQIICSSANKSCSLDLIPTWFLKSTIDSFLPIITHIVNTSISTGIFPDSLKHAIVTPILKKPSADINELANYRPVSNLPFLSKVIEKVIVSRITAHMDDHNLWESHQSAYRSGYSTETALLSIKNDIHVMLAIGDKKRSVPCPSGFKCRLRHCGSPNPSTDAQRIHWPDGKSTVLVS